MINGPHTDCPQHGTDCIWYRHNPDNVGLDLGYGDGYSNARDFAKEHDPILSADLPVSNGRGDYFALGFFTGATTAWCKEHEGCLGRWPCWLRVQETARLHVLNRAARQDEPTTYVCHEQVTR